ncbi:unnamed protein product [Orchesella dallaii]|uniref:Reverse transcriptase domain-containing protein n=1 Tax=Orchesella dallaii TaxID=48710 RepID=A0ABP1RQP5_9HEXA
MYASAYVDTVMKPIVEGTPAFIKDTTDFLLAIGEVKHNNQGYLATGDVASLYTVIPHTDGLKALKHHLDKRDDQNPSTSCIVRLAELVLTLNAFEFNNQFYQQVSGVAMGTKMGPTYADAFMAYLEEKLFERKPHPPSTVYKRFRDDIFIFSADNVDTFTNLAEELNGMHPNIKIEFNQGRSLPYLDTVVTMTNDSLKTTVYYKPTDSHSYLLYTSHHPRNTRDAIPFSQFLRLRRICSEEEDFLEKGREMKEFFRGKLYPNRVVEAAFNRVKIIPREVALQQSNRTTEEKLPFVLTFNQIGQATMGTIRELYKDTIGQDAELKRIFPNVPTAAYRRPKNLRDLLVRARLNQERREPHPYPGTIPCNVKKMPYM